MRVSINVALTEVSGEYCERETFSAGCTAADELVLITGALYGRMTRGRCVTTSPVGCHVDVLALLAARCSARRRCHVNVASLVPDHSQPCHRDYRSYLHATYTCLKGNRSIGRILDETPGERSAHQVGQVERGTESNSLFVGMLLPNELHVGF